METSIPQAPEAEEALAFAFVDPNNASLLATARTIVTPADFHDPALSKVFGAVCDIADNNGVLDKVSIAALLRARLQLQDIGGAQAIRPVADMLFDEPRIRELAGAVKEASLRRRILRFAQGISVGARDGMPVPEILSNLGRETAEFHEATRGSITGIGVYSSAIVLRRLSDFMPEEVSWLWQGRIAFGKPTLMVGDPGAGKSYTVLDVVKMNRTVIVLALLFFCIIGLAVFTTATRVFAPVTAHARMARMQQDLQTGITRDEAYARVRRSGAVAYNPQYAQYRKIAEGSGLERMKATGHQSRFD